MHTVIPSLSRGHTDIGWLDSRHSFSFGQYHDPRRMGFGPLRVINEDHVAGGGGFPTHPHANMEIITVVLSGALAHRDSLGNGSAIQPGDVQMMRAGSGIRHSEFNVSATDPVHLLQIWLMPNVQDAAPAYQQKRFAVLDPTLPPPTDWQALVVPQGEMGDGEALHILQDARVLAGRLGDDSTLSLMPQPNRRYWLQVMTGSVRVGGLSAAPVELSAGDALALENEAQAADIKKASGGDAATASLLLFDLPR